jgi:Big-like domain-containing protein
MLVWFSRALTLVLITLALLVGPARAQSGTEAYFVFRQPPRTETFVFKLTDPAKIQQARNLLATGQSKIVIGTIIKQPVYYNPGWSFHFDPKTIGFADFAIELCDASMLLIERDLDNAWPQWCPWSTELVREIAPPAKPGPDNLNPTVSVTTPYRTNAINPTAPVNVPLAANADDPDGAIEKVEFFSQSIRIGEKSAAPYTIDWINIAPGTHSIFAVATDNQGAVTTSKSVTFTVKPPGSGNLIDETDLFVRQQYRDFLNREPDDAGLQFWKNNIERCGLDIRCRETRRIDTSAAFFLSIEFQETGYWAHRFYKASFGRRPMLSEFLPDTRLIGKGVVVNAPGWQEKLESNKRGFADSWINRSSCRAIYDALNNTQYVDALLANTGAGFSPADRDALISAFDNSAKTRAEVLRAVVENQAFYNAEYTAAFVEMQYFGYLGRNPHDAPDNNLDGYNFWLDKLNQFSGNFREAEMVKAFLTSFEYRQRFGTP